MICRPFTLCLALLGLLSLPSSRQGPPMTCSRPAPDAARHAEILNAFFMYRRPGRRSTLRPSLIKLGADGGSPPAATRRRERQRIPAPAGPASRAMAGHAQDLDKLTGAVRAKGYSDLRNRSPTWHSATKQLMDLGGQLYRSLQRENAATVPTLHRAEPRTEPADAGHCPGHASAARR